MAKGQHKHLDSTHSTLFSNWAPEKKKKAPARQRVQVKVVLKSRNAMDALDIPRHLSFEERREQFAKHIGTRDEHIQAIRRFARKYRLRIEDVNADVGIITLSGTVRAMNKAFKVDLHHHEVEHHKTRETHVLLGHEGKASIPEEMHDFVEGIIGLNNPRATHQMPATPDSIQICAAKGVTSAWFARHYKFPEKYRGKGQRIGIISCGGGFDPKDFMIYFKKAGIKSPPKINYVSLNGAGNTAGLNPSADYELYTDCCVAACAAPEAKITVCNVENSIIGFAEGMKYFAARGARSPQVISYSWGASEHTYTQSDINGVNRKLQYATQVNQISIFCATGDFGSTNAVQNGAQTKLAVQYPAASPWVTSCGGTMFEMTGKGKVRKEIAWNAIYLYDMLIHNASGGGFSRMQKRPRYQKHALHSKDYPKWSRNQRGIPDVSAHANVTPDNLCYWILVRGINWVSGGTSAAAPLWAALTVRLNEALQTRIGFFNPLLYQMADSGAIRSIDEGNNAMPNGPASWDSCQGWDPCTGLGVPNGDLMLKWLKKNLK